MKKVNKHRSKQREKVNKHGLKRDIPPNVMQVVRQQCFNGCVICGRLPYEYDHFDPEFNDAREHKAEGIALLCGSHHDDRSYGRLSVQTVKKKRSNPYNRGRPAIWSHCLTEDILILNLGGNMVQGPSVGLSINGAVVLGMKAPATTDGQWLLTGTFNDPDGKGTLQFHDNEVIIEQGSWDFKIKGPKLTVRTGLRKLVAQVSFRPNDQIISLDRLEMRLANGHKLSVSNKGIQIKGANSKGAKTKGTNKSGLQIDNNLVIRGSGTAISINHGSYQPNLEFSTFEINRPELGTPEDWRQ